MAVRPFRFNLAIGRPLGTRNRPGEAANVASGTWSEPWGLRAMILLAPYPAELVRVARKVVWYDSPEETLAHLPDFLMHLMIYGSWTDAW